MASRFRGRERPVLCKEGGHERRRGKKKNPRPREGKGCLPWRTGPVLVLWEESRFAWGGSVLSRDHLSDSTEGVTRGSYGKERAFLSKMVRRTGKGAEPTKGKRPRRTRSECQGNEQVKGKKKMTFWTSKGDDAKKKRGKILASWCNRDVKKEARRVR